MSGGLLHAHHQVQVRVCAEAQWRDAGLPQPTWMGAWIEAWRVLTVLSRTRPWWINPAVRVVPRGPLMEETVP